MNKTDRMLAIVLELQGKGRLRAEDLARTFETSKRTIYRDIEALCEAGVPLISSPGHGYMLMQGYFLPPLSFTTEEATMLLLGSDFMAQNFDAQYRTAALAASRKIESVLPEGLREDVHYLQQSIRLLATGGPERLREDQRLPLLRRAILERTTVRFDYYTRHSQESQSTLNTRSANPYGLIYFANAWHLIAFCHLRQSQRHFRLDRMENLELLTGQTFQRPQHFKMQRPPEEPPRPLIVRALFDPEISRWVQESRPFHAIASEETPTGLLMTFALRQPDELLHWLLGWGRHVHVLEPESMRAYVAQEAEALLLHHQQKK